MDRPLAATMFAELRGRKIGGWVVLELINNGKSAVVFLAERDGQRAALKIFDPEIVARYGREAQLTRIDRERSLVGKEHPNLIRVFDGGEDGGHLYVVMELFDGKNLAEVLQNVPAVEVKALVAQVASAAKFLEGLSLAHRDIKPENIGISPDFKTAKLLDLGVLRPFDFSSVTDHGDQHVFVGTLQYSPPEFMYREEAPSAEAWRAITFYQLGGVLHDLLMRKPLFAEFTTPYTRLVRAVEREIPKIDAPGLDPTLRLMAGSCLAKSPDQRLRAIRWEDFLQPTPSSGDPLEAARRRIAKVSSAAAAQIPEMPPRLGDLIRSQLYSLRTSIHSAVVSTCNVERLPRYAAKTIYETPYILIRTHFGPDPRVGLQQHFAIYCSGSIADATGGLHELRMSACLSASRDDVPTEPDITVPVVLRTGRLTDDDIRVLIQQFVVLAYAEALEKSASNGATVLWLTVGGIS